MMHLVISHYVSIMTKVLGLIGSLRKNSYNRGLMNAFIKQTPEGASLSILEIGQLPFYNTDVEEAGLPESVAAFKAAIEAADAIIIATPEYNRGVPGVLKNATDWASRPYGQNSFKGKTVLVVGASGGPIGTAVSQYELKKTLLYLDTKVIGQPEFYLGNAGEKFSPEGELTDEDTKKYIDRAWGVLMERI